MLELEAYLAAGRHRVVTGLVGAPLTATMPLAEYQPQVRFVLPREQGGGTLSVDAEASATELTAVLGDTAAAGVYEAQWAQRGSGEIVLAQVRPERRPARGKPRPARLRRTGRSVAGIDYLYQQAQDVVYDGERLSGPNLGRFFMWLLIAVLLSEQVLAYSASYHPARRGAAA